MVPPSIGSTVHREYRCQWIASLAGTVGATVGKKQQRNVRCIAGSMELSSIHLYSHGPWMAIPTRGMHYFRDLSHFANRTHPTSPARLHHNSRGFSKGSCNGSTFNSSRSATFTHNFCGFVRGSHNRPSSCHRLHFQVKCDICKR